MIPNVIVRNNGISNMSKMIYTSFAMSRNINQTRLFQQTSISALLGMAGYKQRTENQNMAKQGLIELLELGFISVYSDLALSKEIKPIDIKGSTKFFVKFNDEDVYSKMFVNRFADGEVDKELIETGFTYTTVYVDDAIQLFIYETKLNRANLISFYLMALSRALIGDKGNKYSTEPIEALTKYANINEKTAYTYIKVLFDCQLLFKITMRQTAVRTGEIREHNVYTRWCDSDVVMNAMEVNDWLMSMTLLKIGERVISESERKTIKNKSRKQYGLSEIY